jgi:hypothetical protein
MQRMRVRAKKAGFDDDAKGRWFAQQLFNAIEAEEKLGKLEEVKTAKA